MTTTADEPSAQPHLAHYHVAQSIIRAFAEALEPYFRDRNSITKAELDKAFASLDRIGPSVIPLFERTCQRCPIAGPAAWAADDRRQDFLTRLIFARIVSRLPTRMDPYSGQLFPQVVVRGIQRNIGGLFQRREWDLLNDQAKSIFAQIGTDEDDRVWRLIQQQPVAQAVAEKILMRLLLRFRNFNLKRQEFTRTLVQNVATPAYKVSDEDFCLLFEAMFGEFETVLAREEGRVILDAAHGDETGDKVAAILFAFRQFRDGVRPDESRRARASRL